MDILNNHASEIFEGGKSSDNIQFCACKVIQRMEDKP